MLKLPFFNWLHRIYAFKRLGYCSVYNVFYEYMMSRLYQNLRRILGFARGFGSAHLPHFLTPCQCSCRACSFRNLSFLQRACSWLQGLAWTSSSQDCGRSHTYPAIANGCGKLREVAPSLKYREFMIASMAANIIVIAICSHDDSQTGRIMSRDIIYGRRRQPPMPKAPS